MRFRRVWLLLLLLPVPAVPRHVAAETPASGDCGTALAVQAVSAVGVTVADMDRALAFYTGVLEFEKTSDIEVSGDDYERLLGVFGLRVRIVGLALGEESMELLHFLAPRGRPVPADSRGNDEWFQHVAIIVSDMDRAYEHLRRHKVEHASSGPQTLPQWNQKAGGIRAFYFRDPDGHFLEILWFPPGKGDPKWQRSSDRLFRGIDHTAIVVKNTDASLRLYRDALGMRVAGESENFGTEQEHLNNVFGARLRITTLRAGSGPGIELLEYLAPRDGRAVPGDTRCNDLWHWHVRLRPVTAISPMIAPGHEGRAVSPGVAELGGGGWNLSRGLMFRDPDGHALMLAEP
ncbi:MAG: VOC family protein [Planctomycetes bacterium]|nr:VOC family protein [Planctomycetota bacterium]